MKLDEVESQKDYDLLMEIYKYSEAPFDVRSEAINRLKRTYPQFDREIVKDAPNDAIAVEGDTSDMKGH